MKPITIIGGGLAGLTLGIGLRREGVPVTIWEAGSYPRHRVCGEFISGRGLQTLQRFGLLDEIQKQGRNATTAAFFARDRSLFAHSLPQKAPCISRLCLDAFFARQFCNEGGQLLLNSRWKEQGPKESVVRATGRRIQMQAEGFRWYGLKAHVEGIELKSDLEMHFDSNSYIGLCRLSDNRVNVCGLFRARPGDARAPGFKLLKESVRARNAQWDEDSFCAVAGLPPYPAISKDACAVGDALSMPAPVTGNGMSMAFESAELAVKPLARYARGLIGWGEAAGQLQKVFRQAFGKRLKWSCLLHRLLFAGPATPLLVRAVGGGCWKWLFHRTR
jgi:2-polyprenyl-6-methoxyphenol hydroxylase-like FAD-dependent oxidoreductase